MLEPKGWALLSFLMDARTGLGRFHDFRISNYELMMQLIDCCRDMSIDEILALPDVAERVELYHDQHERFVEQVERVAEVRDNLVVLDLRAEDVIYAGNRFVVYALFPDCDISMHVMWGRRTPQHRLHGRQVDLRPVEQRRRRRAHAASRRWRSPRGGNLPGSQRDR